jgi:phage tail-like protein
VRGAIPDLTNPVALRHRIPGVLQDDEFTCRFLDAFDAGFAPILATLDGLAGYVDPWLAPEDFLDWLAGWVGVELDDAWTLEQRRTIVAGAALVHRQRGTVTGITEALRLALDGRVTVVDSGGCAWSGSPGGDLPGDAVPSMVVRIEFADPDRVDVRRIEALIDAVKPAHVRHSTDLVRPSHARTDAEEEAT